MAKRLVGVKPLLPESSLPYLNKASVRSLKRAALIFDEIVIPEISAPFHRSRQRPPYPKKKDRLSEAELSWLEDPGIVSFVAVHECCAQKILSSFTRFVRRGWKLDEKPVEFISLEQIFEVLHSRLSADPNVAAFM